MSDLNTAENNLQKTLVYRLRSAGKRMPESEIDGGSLMNEAADEIERWQKLYESAVRGRQEFRQLCREMLTRVEKLP